MSNNYGNISGSFKSSFGNVLGTALGIIAVGVVLSLYNSRVKGSAKQPVGSTFG